MHAIIAPDITIVFIILFVEDYSKNVASPLTSVGNVWTLPLGGTRSHSDYCVQSEISSLY